jgi:hypothetical protein
MIRETMNMEVEIDKMMLDKLKDDKNELEIQNIKSKGDLDKIGAPDAKKLNEEMETFSNEFYELFITVNAKQ